MWRWGHARTCCRQASAETTGSGYASALPKPKKPSFVNKPAAREAAATSAATIIVEAARTAETTQIDSGATALLAGAAVLVSPPPSCQTHSAHCVLCGPPDAAAPGQGWSTAGAH